MNPTPEQIEAAKKLTEEIAMHGGTPSIWIAQFLAARDAAKDREIAELRNETDRAVALSFDARRDYEAEKIRAEKAEADAKRNHRECYDRIVKEINKGEAALAAMTALLSSAPASCDGIKNGLRCSECVRTGIDCRPATSSEKKPNGFVPLVVLGYIVAAWIVGVVVADVLPPPKWPTYPNGAWVWCRPHPYDKLAWKPWPFRRSRYTNNWRDGDFDECTGEIFRSGKWGKP